MTTLGQTIGKVKDSFSITNHADVKVNISVTWDFTTCTDNDIKLWLAGNRRIAFQRPSRSLSESELKDLDGTTIMANSAGQKVKSREERIAEYVNAIGCTEKQAAILVDDPEKAARIMAMLEDDEPEPKPDTILRKPETSDNN